MLVKMETQAAGGVDGIIVGIQHKSTDALYVFSTLTATKEKDGPIAHYKWGNTEESHNATNYGHIFDFTIAVTSNVSLRIYSNSSSIPYILVDVIKNGTTVESGIQIDTISNKSYMYQVYFELFI